ncbi:hypothetical protein [Paraburkholderia sp. 2C]|jgi:hypothetical protein
MERIDIFTALRQLSAAAEILAKAGPDGMRADAVGLLEFFRTLEKSGGRIERDAALDGALFVQTAQAALALVGRNEFAAARALLEQAQSLLNKLE